MADPPTIVSQKVVDSEGDGKGGEAMGEGELVVVKEGYFRYIDILFEWCKYMNPWQKNAVKALLNGEALTHPDHPLRQPGQDGIELYISTIEGGKQNLLFSLRQLEYLQYYIHHFQLADPKVVKELNVGGAITWPEDCNFDEVKVDNWIPLPMNVLLPEVIGKIEPMVFNSLGAIKKELSRIQKYNKHVKREQMMMRGTQEEKNRAEAAIDNEREGPGLRRGPIKKSYAREEKDDVEGGWGKGWQDDEKYGESVVGNADPAESNDVPSLIPSAGSSETDPSRPPSSLFQVPDTPSQHYHHAQQALLLASQGGLVTALAHRPDAAPEGEPTESQAKIGRSLFMALDLVTWEKDESVILEIGWSAVWWQAVDPEKPFGEFEEMTDKGHYIVQDHLLQSKNGDEKPNHRDKYLFGNSLPVKQEEIALTVEKLLADLSKRAGGGPTYIVLHSPKGRMIAEHAKYIQLGLFSVDWIETLRPTVSEFPPYADESGLGQTFIIDTATLFGNIENGLGGDVLGKTGKSLDEVALIMFGDSGVKPEYTANAGNRASYLIQVFLSIVTGPDLQELQEDYKQSQTATSTVEKSTSKSAEKVVQEPITFVRPEIVQPSASAPESDSEEDEDGIKGVYFEDDDGELAEYKDDMKS